MTRTPNTRNGFADPAWFETFKGAYASAQAFILHLGVTDYVVPGIRLPAYLSKKFAGRDVVAFYDRARGITFPLPSMENRARELLNMDAAEQNDALVALGLATGQTAGDWPKVPSAALPLLERLLQADAKVTVIIEYAETILPAADLNTMSPDDRNVMITLSRWGTDKPIERAGNFAFLICGNLAELHPALRSASNCYKAIEIPLPDLESRLAFIEWYLEVKPIDSDLTAAELARATAGLSLVHIENIFLQADVAGRLTWELARQAKADIIGTEFYGILEMLEPTYGFDAIGGMEPLKAWSRYKIADPVRGGRLSKVPQSVLLVGPPGTGKTMFVKGLAKEIGFNAVALNVENILGGIVGESERKLAKALAAVRSLAPVLVFIDEVDQSGISSRGNNSGSPVDKNLFNMMLRFLSDPGNKGQVVFFMASNRPDLIDTAFKRFGRTDAIIPCMLPGADERIAIAAVQIKSQGFTAETGVAELIASKSERYSAADIGAVVTKAGELADRRDGDTHITTADASLALQLIRADSVKTAQGYEALAIEACKDAELLPPQYRPLFENQEQLADQIKEFDPAPRRRREL